MRPPHFLRAFWYGIENLWRWFPVIWNDRDWDHLFLLKILETKLGHMEKFFDSDDPIICEAKTVASQIGSARRACKRLMDADHHSLAYKEHDERWGDLTLVTKPSLDEWELQDVQDDLGRISRLNVRTYKGHSDFHRANILRSRLQPGEEAEELASHLECQRVEMELEQLDRETCFDTIRDKYSWWWD